MEKEINEKHQQISIKINNKENKNNKHNESFRPQ